MRQYRSSAKDCPLRSGCIGRSPKKKIEVTADKPLYDRMHQRLQTPKAKRMKKIRSATVEPVLGTLVNFLGMRRVNTRGLEQSNKCMQVAAVAYNLKKLLTWKERKIETGVSAVQEELAKAWVWLCSIITISYRYQPACGILSAN